MAIDAKDHSRCWHVVNEPYHKFDLHDNSIFVLHPNDEKPMIRDTGEYLSQFQHGNVSVKKGLLSIGLVFCHVTKSLIYDNVTGKRVLPKHYLGGKRESLQTFDVTMDNFKKLQAIIPDQFRYHATLKSSRFPWV